MPIPITRYGQPQVTLVPTAILILGILTMLFCPAAGLWPIIIAPILALATLAFFRDPNRTIPTEKNIMLSPADGKITDIGPVTESQFIKGPAIRIGIFLSVFDVHINRTPCAGTAEYINSRPGKCINALRYEKASAENQSLSLGLTCPDGPTKKVMIKQITGAIARRIVCAPQIGDKLTQGQKYGMIKFGSRTELFLPADPPPQIIVQKGQTVRAGTTILAKYPQKD